MGVTVPDDIPDCAWIPRDSLECFEEPQIVAKGDLIVVTGKLKTTQPFKWIEVDFKVHVEF